MKSNTRCARCGELFIPGEEYSWVPETNEFLCTKCHPLSEEAMPDYKYSQGYEDGYRRGKEETQLRYEAQLTEMINKLEEIRSRAEVIDQQLSKLRYTLSSPGNIVRRDN